uniref:lipase family protein n=1 Tax=Inquilinus sp. TaxID=1932117 RepID=UPI0031D37EFB
MMRPARILALAKDRRVTIRADIGGVMTPQEIKQGATGQAGTSATPFAISYLQLCQISYFSTDQIPEAVPGMPPPGENAPDSATGSWSVVWGPATDWDDSNLAYATAYTDAASNLPVLLVVCLRGTDVHVDDPWGILKQLFEDLRVPDQVALPWAPTSAARVAKGTLSALEVIQKLSSGGQTLSDFVTGYLNDSKNQQPVLVVTGHSLGGALTTVVAPWLQSLGTITSPIVPATFAAPTAGNADFAALYGTDFSYSLRYWNDYDIVPNAWWNLPGIATIYQPCNLTPPSYVTDGLTHFENELQGVSYAQPAADTQLFGSCSSLAKTWAREI